MATGEFLEIEAENLEEAQNQLISYVQKGFYIKHDIISDGNPVTIKSMASTTEEAFAKAQAKIPNDAIILDKKEFVTPENKTITFGIRDQDMAMIRAKRKAKEQLGDTATIENLNLVKKGRKGFLGIGAKDYQFEAKAARNAIVEITYKQNFKVSAQIIEKESLWAMYRDTEGTLGSIQRNAHEVLKETIELLLKKNGPQTKELIITIIESDLIPNYWYGELRNKYGFIRSELIEMGIFPIHPEELTGISREIALAIKAWSREQAKLWWVRTNKWIM